MGKDKVERFIASVRNAAPEIMVPLFCYGGCWEFYLILRQVFPEAEPWHDAVQGHVLTKIGDKFYDITGQVYPNGRHTSRMTPFVYRTRKPTPHRWKNSVNTPIRLTARIIQLEGTDAFKHERKKLREVRNRALSETEDDTQG